MRSPAADRALRRLVVRLAARSPADIALVLEGLEADQREEVSALLAAYGAPDAGPPLNPVRPPRPEPPPEPEPEIRSLAGFSPWLAEHLAAALGGAAGAAPGRLTTAGAATVKAIALALPVETPQAPPAARASGGLRQWLQGPGRRR